MSLELVIDRGKDDARRATMQFAARRGFHVTEPWHLDGLRLEALASHDLAAPPSPGDSDDLDGLIGGIASFFGDGGKQRVYLDVEFRRDRQRTVVHMKSGKHAAGMKIAYALHGFLMDEAAYEPAGPPVCPTCTTPVVNLRASFCGRCGAALTQSKERARPGKPAAPKGREQAGAERRAPDADGPAPVGASAAPSSSESSEERS